MMFSLSRRRFSRRAISVGIASIAATALVGPAAAQAAPTNTTAGGMPVSFQLTTTGVNPYNLNADAATLASKGWATVIRGGDPCPLEYQSKAPHTKTGLQLGVKNNKVFRVSVRDSRYRTPSNAYVSMTEAALKKVYGAKLKYAGESYDGWYGYRVDDSRGFAIGFSVNPNTHKVTAMHSGTKLVANDAGAGFETWPC